MDESILTAEIQAPAGVSSAATQASVNILLVDDEPRNLAVLESILEAPDLQLCRAQTAEEALLLLLQRDFAAIVLDVQMPGLSGFDIARLIKQRRRSRHIPIIFITAFYHEDKDVLSGYDAGAVDYLTKPVNPQILKSKITVFVDLFRTTRALSATNTALEHEISGRQKAEEALRQANVELEFRVQQRTAELLQANRELRHSEERYRFILENALEYAVFTVNEDGCVSSWNSGAERIFQFGEQEIIGRHLDVILSEEDRKRGLLTRDMGSALAHGKSQDERWYMRKDGSRVWASVVMIALKREDGRTLGFLKILCDRTTQKQAEEQLRETEILRASEREQCRISQDLHDGLGQQLSGISLLSSGLKRDLEQKGLPQAAGAAKISRLLDDAVAQTRGLAKGLQPVAPEPNGLMSALEDLGNRITDVFKVSCHFQCRAPVLVVDNTKATHLFRIAQEAVTNALKHGRARNVDIGLTASGAHIVLTVRDNGVGLKKNAGSRKGMGLRIMRNRARVMGGTLAMRNRNGGGVEIVCTVNQSDEH